MQDTPRDGSDARVLPLLKLTVHTRVCWIVIERRREISRRVRRRDSEMRMRGGDTTGNTGDMQGKRDERHSDPSLPAYQVT